MAQSKAHIKATNKYNAKAYDRIAFQVYKGQRDKLKNYCQQQGISLNSLISASLAYCIANDVDLANTPTLADVLPEGDGFSSED